MTRPKSKKPLSFEARCALVGLVVPFLYFGIGFADWQDLRPLSGIVGPLLLPVVFYDAGFVMYGTIKFVLYWSGIGFFVISVLSFAIAMGLGWLFRNRTRRALWVTLIGVLLAVGFPWATAALGGPYYRFVEQQFKKQKARERQDRRDSSIRYLCQVEGHEITSCSIDGLNCRSWSFRGKAEFVRLCQTGDRQVYVAWESSALPDAARWVLDDAHMSLSEACGPDQRDGLCQAPESCGANLCE